MNARTLDLLFYAALVAMALAGAAGSLAVRMGWL